MKINKPWGYELIWAKTNKYVGKILFINKGHKLSKQYHLKKDETILLKKGKMTLEINDSLKEINVGDSFHIKPGVIHRMIAVEDCEVIEVSTPELKDVVRLEDDYNRCEKISSKQLSFSY